VIHDRATKARVNALFLQDEVAAATTRAHAPRSTEAEARGDPRTRRQCLRHLRPDAGRAPRARRNTSSTPTSSAPAARLRTLACRSRGGHRVGWVSILDNDELRAILGIPKRVCPSPISASATRRTSWTSRAPAARLGHRLPACPRDLPRSAGKARAWDPRRVAPHPSWPPSVRARAETYDEHLSNAKRKRVGKP